MKKYVAFLVLSILILSGCVVSNPVNTNTTQVAVGQTVLSLSTSTPSGQLTPALNQTVAVIQMISEGLLPDDNLHIKVTGSFASMGGKVTNLKIMNGDQLIAGPMGSVSNDVVVPLRGLSYTAGQTLQLRVVLDTLDVRSGATEQPVSLGIQATLEKQNQALVQSPTLVY